MPWAGLSSVIMAFPDHRHLWFYVLYSFGFYIVFNNITSEWQYFLVVHLVNLNKSGVPLVRHQNSIRGVLLADR